MKIRNKLICLTPVKNESWILDKFLACASFWADHIIIADQMSDDGSREIAAKYSKVTLIDNNSEAFNEPERQQLLFKEGLKIEGPKIFIVLDADEFLSANYYKSPEWDQILYAPTGTVFHFNWVNILPGFKRAWIAGSIPPSAIAADKVSHRGPGMHSPRVPLPENGKVINLTDIKILHYQYTDWQRMQSKHCWYLCYECINHPEKKLLAIYRTYHHMYLFLKRKKFTVPLDEEWFDYYTRQGINMKEFIVQKFWWDSAVVKLMLEYGTKKFAGVYIWYRDWNAISKTCFPENQTRLTDPRSILMKCIHWYLQVSQPYRNSIPVRVIDMFLKKIGF